jgi:hypothetical protein
MGNRNIEAYTLYEQYRDYDRVAREMGISLSAARGMASKGRAAQPKVTDLYTVDELTQLREENARLKAALDDYENPLKQVGEAWKFDGDWIIAGDIHLNTMNRVWAQQPLAIAKRWLTGKRRMLLAGDFLNMDAFSNYESDVSSHAFRTELAAGRDFLKTYLDTFDDIYILMGNHDRRPGKRTKGTIKAEMVYQMIAPYSDRVHVSSWGWATIQARTGTWRVTHGSNYSVNTLAVASNLAQKFQQHIIGHHQHHLAVGFDRYKRYLVIDNGGLFLEDHLLYTRLDDNTMPRMVNGFTMLKDGYPTVFGPPPFTDWRKWLDDENVVKLEAA